MMLEKVKENQLLTNLSKSIKVLSDLPELSRMNTVMKEPLKVIDDEKMGYILERSEEINNKIYNFSKSTSQVSRKLQSMSMLFPADATYRVLQQVLAQVESRQQAITENIVKIKKDMIKIQELKEKIDQTTNNQEQLKIQTMIEQKQVNLSNSMSYVEAALKELGYLIETYEEIKKNKGISDEWDEEDFEQAEIKAQIEGAFREAIRDFLVHGRMGMAGCEWMEQLGISPMEAIYEVLQFLQVNEYNINNAGKPLDYDAFYDFLNTMAEKYKDNYKKACKRIGIDNELISKKFTLISNSKKELESKKEE